MEKESYSIDDILSEVKKRREENEAALKNQDSKKAPEAKKVSAPFESEAPKTAPKDDEELAISFEKEDKPAKEPEKEETFYIKEEVQPKEQEPEVITLTDDEPKTPKAEEPKDVKIEIPVSQPQENDDIHEINIEESPEPASETDETAEERLESDDIISDNQGNQEIQDNQQEHKVLLTEPDSNGMVDLLSLAADDDYIIKEEAKPESKEQKKKNKVTKTVIIILVIMVVAAAIFAILFANNILDKVTNNEEEDPYQMVTYYDGMDFLQEDFPTIDELSAGELYSYKEYLKQWYQNGDPVSSTHVMNILLIGEDTREKEISDTSRADSAIIASINIDTQEIHLTSILRDLYVYYEVDGEGHYGKINESASMGGMKTYINTIERYYKLVINNYAVVNFASFPKIIDALDGVTINITSAEINEINNHPKRYGGVTITQNFDGTEGKMKLNGEQALAYCRIRKIDSDGARANRQKTVLSALLKKMTSSGAIDIVKTVNELVDYVYTGYDKKELIEIGNTALKDSWLSYEIKTSNVPSTDNCKGGQNFSAAPGNWIWLADIPKDAYELQMRIYGKSNINLNENRADYIALGR
ncbi:MAG: LCP family protein [Eubacteriales bacterium]|nr:LCP family protein [Eubacteriales bacterium]